MMSLTPFVSAVQLGCLCGWCAGCADARAGPALQRWPFHSGVIGCARGQGRVLVSSCRGGDHAGTGCSTWPPAGRAPAGTALPEGGALPRNANLREERETLSSNGAKSRHSTFLACVFREDLCKFGEQENLRFLTPHLLYPLLNPVQDAWKILVTWHLLLMLGGELCSGCPMRGHGSADVSTWPGWQPAGAEVSAS